MPEMEIIITPEGMTIDASGYRGKDCIKDLEKFVAEMKKHGVSVIITNQNKKSESRMLSSSPASRSRQ